MQRQLNLSPVKMAEQLEAQVEERHGDGAEVAVMGIFALVFEEGEIQLHWASNQHNGGNAEDKDVLIGALGKWIEVLKGETGEIRRIG